MLGHLRPVVLEVFIFDRPTYVDLQARSSLKVDVRRAIENEYLEYYGAKMAEHGVNDYSLDQIREDYDVALLFIMNFNILIAGAFVPSSERDRQMAIAGLERAIAAVLDRGLLARIPA